MCGRVAFLNAWTRLECLAIFQSLSFAVIQAIVLAACTALAGELLSLECGQGDRVTPWCMDCATTACRMPIK